MKAYADALVTVFPEVKDMGSAEEVLAFVKTLRKSTERADTGTNTSATQTAVVRELVSLPSRRTAITVPKVCRVPIPSTVPLIKTRLMSGHGESSLSPTYGRVVLSDRTC